VSTQSETQSEWKIEADDYPALYQAADCASQEAQSTYLRYMRWYLGLMIAGAAFAVYADDSSASGIVAALFLLGTLGLALLQAFKRFDDTWYNGRAVAESVKTRSWRYMMRSEPYKDVESVVVAKKEFCNDLKQILKQNRSLAEHIGGDASTQDAISQKMNQIRALDVADRLNIYRSKRIDEQRSWYAVKYKQNKKTGKLWFITMVVLHALAIFLLFVQIANSSLDILPTEAIVVAAGSVLTWIQVKRYQDNATAYSLAAHEIGIIRQDSVSVDCEKQLSDFVKDSENAFSREHTQWVARKDA
jgi:hypothetical protein